MTRPVLRLLLLAACALCAPVHAQPAADTAAPVLELYEAGDYYAASRRGATILAAHPELHELRLAVANSLAWTGRYDPALEHYRALLQTRYDAEARLGIADVLRSRERADLSLPYYDTVLKRDPANEEARRARDYAERDVRPALTARVTSSADNQGMSRREAGLGYRQWSADRTWRFEAGAIGERDTATDRTWSPHTVYGSAWAAGSRWSPRIDAELYQGLGGSDLFATLQAEPLDGVRVRLGRVNWGRLAFTSAAAADRLTARLVGASADAYTPLGSFRARLDSYSISDGNRIVDGEALLTPDWQPLPARLVWFTGVAGRNADRADPRYWSPDPTYAVTFLGLKRGWFSERGELTASVRRGFAITEGARDSWTLALGGRYWISKDLAVGLDGWAIDTPRPTPYTMHSVSAYIQQLW